MSKNKITRWIDRNNYKVCLVIVRKFYKRKAKGSLFFFYTDIVIYPFFAARFFLVFLQLFRFNRDLLRQYPSQKIKSFAHSVSYYISVFAGLRYFVKKEYTPIHYEDTVPVSNLFFEEEEFPKVSIIIPVYNQLYYTLNCLRSLRLNLPEDIAVEIIVINDASTDNTLNEVAKIKGVNLVNNLKNIGFLNSCRKAIEISKGQYVCLLNNDTVVLKGWLEALVETMQKDTSVGLVGSKLIHPFGLLQEAGGIIYNDGNCGNYGAYRDSNHYAYNYLREVDYCTGASILFRRTDYDELDGLDLQYVPAYYEDTDFCMSIRHLLHKKVVYQPLSALVHFEGVSSGKKAKKGNIKSYQIINKAKFADKWKDNLKGYFPVKNVEESARKYIRSRTLIIIDSYLPRFDKESGSHRVYELVKIFQGLGFHLIFIPDNGKAEQPYFNLLTGSGIEVITRYAGWIKFKNDIISACEHADYVWACRPHLNRKYNFIRNHKPAVKWFYDTVDLHYIRLEREAALLSSKKTFSKAKRYKKLELFLANKADITVCITDVEQQFLKNEGIFNTIVVPNIHALPLNTSQNSFNQRKDLLFIGSYDHTPNVDAVVWLCNDIMPIIWVNDPTIKVHIIGNNPKKDVLSLASERIVVHGYVEDLEPFFNSCRVFVAPLRYGAGMKGKIGQSLSFGIPTVTTNIGAEGMGLVPQENILIANTEKEFADAAILLYNNSVLWEKIREGSIKTVDRYSPETVTQQLEKIFS